MSTSIVYSGFREGVRRVSERQHHAAEVEATIDALTVAVRKAVTGASDELAWLRGYRAAWQAALELMTMHPCAYPYPLHPAMRDVHESEYLMLWRPSDEAPGEYLDPFELQGRYFAAVEAALPEDERLSHQHVDPGGEHRIALERLRCVRRVELEPVQQEERTEE